MWPTICTTIKLISLSQLGVEGLRIHISSHDAKNFSTSFHSESHNILSPRNTILQFVKILFTSLQDWFHVSLVTQMQRHFTQHWHCKALLQGLCVKAPLSQVEPRRNFEYCEFQEFTMKVGELLLILLWLLKVRYHLHHDISIRI